MQFSQAIPRIFEMQLSELACSTRIFTNLSSEEIVTYQNEKHSELGMSPNEKWEQGLQSEPPPIPFPSIDVERLFWRLHHQNS